MRKLFTRIWRRLVATLQLWLLTLTDQRSAQLIRQVRRQGLSFLGLAALLDLHNVVRKVEQRTSTGVFIEMGTALGGSAMVLAAAKRSERPLLLYDVFDQIPPPSAEDGGEAQQRYAEISTGAAKGIGDGVYYGYQENLLASVQESFRQHGFDLQEQNLHFIPGLYEETLEVSKPVAFAHIDCDWYESVKVCLERIVPQLTPGGVLVLDDYHQWPGCKRAVDEYFAGRQGEFTFVMKARLHITKRRP